MSKATRKNTPLSQFFQSAYLCDRFAAAAEHDTPPKSLAFETHRAAEAGRTDDGIAMAMLCAARDLADAAERLRVLIETHAKRSGVSMAE